MRRKENKKDSIEAKTRGQLQLEGKERTDEAPAAKERQSGRETSGAMLVI